MSDNESRTGSGQPTTNAEQTAEDCRAHREDLIDKALKESFPASDPPSIARPACMDEAEEAKKPDSDAGKELPDAFTRGP